MHDIRYLQVYFILTCVFDIAGSYVIAASQSDEDLEFDGYMLKGRNIDQKMARFFSKGARFAEGAEAVTLYVNGAARGRYLATFDKQGKLVFTQELLSVAKLNMPESSSRDETVIEDLFLKTYPATEIDLKPGRREVWLIVPTDAIRKDGIDLHAFSQGGVAGLFNYNVMGVNNNFNGVSSEFRYLDTVVGFNAGDWVVRSRQNYSVQDGGGDATHMYAYAQKNITSLTSTFQGGQIKLENSLFSGTGITGFQVFPETGLRKLEQGNGAEVEGLANSTARVEVRQNGVLVYSTVVPAGPFRLSDLPLLNSSADLDVRVVEASGEVRSFTVPGASFSGGTRGAIAGYSLAVGQYRAEESAEPGLITASGTWNPGRNTSLSAGFMIADGYESFGWASDHPLAPGIRLGIRQLNSRAEGLGEQGSMLSVTMSAQLSSDVNMSFSATRRTNGYLELGETTYDQGDSYREISRSKGQYTLSTGWLNQTLGGFRLAYSYSEQFDGESRRRLIGSWSKKIKDASVSVNIERSLNEVENDFDGNRATFSVSFPLGQGSIRTYANHDQQGTRTGANYSQKVSDTFNYRVQAERDSQDGEADLSFSANMLPYYTRASVGYSRNGSNSESYNGNLSGSVVVHPDGVTFSPYEVEDTFSILSVGDMGGVKVVTSDGPVWTDAGGRAVASRLQPYQSNRMQISAKSLPRNVDIVNGYKEVKVGRGSVSRVEFDVVTSRRLLMYATLSDGSPVVKGASVFSGDQYLTTVVDYGQIFIPDIGEHSNLTVELGDGETCRLDFYLPDKANDDVYFEKLNAVCRQSSE